MDPKIYCAVFVAILVILVVVVWWFMAVYQAIVPPPDQAQEDFNQMLVDFEAVPSQLWFFDRRCQFANLPDIYRYIIYESDGRIVYDSNPNQIRPDFRNTFEYYRAITLGRGTVVR